VLRGTSKINNTQYLPWDLRHKIRELELIGRRIEFFWVPDNCGIQINEKANPGAKDGLNNRKDSQFLLS
jgi:hypothetical protein